MKTYWDFTDRERAEMTAEDVTRLLDFELMQKGVYKPKPLQLQPTERPPLKKRSLFVVESCGHRLDVAFSTPEAARAFVDLAPIVVETDWSTGDNVMTCRALGDTRIYADEVRTPESLAEHRSELKRITAAETANRLERERFDKEQKAVEQATRGVWDDWNEQRAKAREMERIADAREEYERLCSGNVELARTFLAKTFGADKLAEFARWMGEDCKTPEKTPDREPADDIAF